jgi:GNAT superfamily N-acetyltransferase
MGWPAYGLPRREDDLEPCLEDPTSVEQYRIDVIEVSEPGPVVEIRDLLCRLYGKPDEVGAQNAYLATYKRLRGIAVPQSDQAHKHVIGTVEYGYWPSLKLGYIETVRVRSDMRRKGFGLKLVDFAVDYMRGRKIQRLYSFAINIEGNALLESAGFVPEPPGDSEHPWRRWFSTA